MKVINLMIALWLGFISFAVLADAGETTECTDAEESAQEAYDKTAEAYNSGNKGLANWRSQSFFEIYEQHKICPFIKLLADKLNSRGITKTAVSSSTGHSDYGNLTNGCQPPCRVVITKPGIGTGTGMGTRGE